MVTTNRCASTVKEALDSALGNEILLSASQSALPTGAPEIQHVQEGSGLGSADY